MPVACQSRAVTEPQRDLDLPQAKTEGLSTLAEFQEAATAEQSLRHGCRRATSLYTREALALIGLRGASESCVGQIPCPAPPGGNDKLVRKMSRSRDRENVRLSAETDGEILLLEVRR